MKEEGGKERERTRGAGPGGSQGEDEAARGPRQTKNSGDGLVLTRSFI